MSRERIPETDFSDRGRSPIGLGSHRFSDPVELFRVIKRLWSADTASPANDWHPRNPAKNHCSVTALIVHDFFGGVILTTDTYGGKHFYNMIDGRRWDLTVGQFEEPIPYEDVPSSRAVASADTSPDKYWALLERLFATLEA